MKKKLLLLSLLLIPRLILCQSVGLVLSGGGARGLIHIGVIRALEERGIPIDYIAGTSMGSIIGGLYAAGYSTEEMEAIFRSNEVELWMNGEVDNRYMYFFKKNQPNSNWLQINFSLDSSFFSPTIPTNLISPKQMDLAFVEIMGAADAASKGDFNRLMVPFRCNATDIGKRKEVVFSNGPLKDAVRASMSFPFVFKPLVLDSCILYDGGMMNNFPTHIMEQEFHPDYTIGVVASQLFSSNPDEENIFSIISSMITEPNRTEGQLAGKGLVLYPPVPQDIGVTDFAKGIDLIETGYRYTLNFIDSIRKDVHRVVPQEAVTRKRENFLQSLPPFCIGSLKINGLSPYQEKIIRPILIKEDEVVSITEFKKRYSKLMLEEKIESIYPHLSFDSIRQNYRIELDIKKKKPISFKFGGHISTGTYTTLYTQVMYQNLGLQSVSTGVDAYFGRFYNSIVGLLRLDYFLQPPFYQMIKFGMQRWNHFDAANRLMLLGQDNGYFLVESNTFFQYNLAFPIRQKSQWKTGFTLFSENNNYFQSRNIAPTDTSDQNIFRGYKLHAVYEYNTTDFMYFSTQGTHIQIEAAYQTGTEINIPGNTSQTKLVLGKTHSWITINGKLASTLKLMNHYRLGLFTHIAVSNQPVFASYTATSLHANTFAPTPESNISYLTQFRNPNFAAIGINNIFTIYKQFQIRMDAYYFQPLLKVEELEDNRVKQRKILLDEFSLLLYAAVAYPTKRGPVAISLSLYPQSGSRMVETLFNISFGYLLFENKIF